MRAANLALKFLLELAALASFAIWGASSESGALAVAHAILAPLIVALLWGRLAAPRSRHGLRARPASHSSWPMTAFDQWDA